MKKDYVKPIAEKIEFDYSVVIATSGCDKQNTYVQYDSPCEGQPTGGSANQYVS